MMSMSRGGRTITARSVEIAASWRRQALAIVHREIEGDARMGGAEGASTRGKK